MSQVRCWRLRPHPAARSLQRIPCSSTTSEIRILWPLENTSEPRQPATANATPANTKTSRSDNIFYVRMSGLEMFTIIIVYLLFPICRSIDTWHIHLKFCEEDNFSFPHHQNIKLMTSQQEGRKKEICFLDMMIIQKCVLWRRFAYFRDKTAVD